MGPGAKRFQRHQAQIAASLRRAERGLLASDPQSAEERGVAFLLNSQCPDGTWLVRTHAFPVQRYFESGFAVGRHQWMSAAGTRWASMAIAQTLPDAATSR